MFLNVSSTNKREYEKNENRALYFLYQKFAAGRFFNSCLTQPNKFVIAVYITNMIFTLYRCNDWQISFPFDSACIRRVFFSASLWLPFRWSNLASFTVCISIQ